LATGSFALKASQCKSAFQISPRVDMAPMLQVGRTLQ
jgi:hypothetical protein